MKRYAIALLACLSLSIPVSAYATDWRVPGDFPTIQAALESASVQTGDVIVVGAGSHAGAYVAKSVEIRGEGGAIINSGPAHPSGLIMGFRLLDGSKGATISHLTFAVDLAVMNGAAVADVTIVQNKFLNAVQAVSNWGGNGWDISHNEIVDLRSHCGGGIGILVGAYDGNKVQDNLVAHNKISGTLHVPSDDCGGYSGTGIVVYSDFRWGRLGGELSFNRVIKNKVSLVSDTASLVDVNAFELTDTRDADALTSTIFSNAIGFNDFRGSTNEILLTPATLDNPVNDISRNFGENRRAGLSPKLFKAIR